MQQQSDELALYIEALCSRHTAIKHSKDEKHFIGPDDNAQLNELRNNSHCPLVIMDNISASYSGSTDAISKTYHLELLFLMWVESVNNQEMIEQSWKDMWQIAEDFIKQIPIDRRSGKFEVLKTAQTNNCEISYITGINGNLYGVSLSMEIDVPFSQNIEKGRFEDVLSNVYTQS